MSRKQISCEECGFFGTLSYKDEECTFINVVYCPICSYDISEDVTEDDFDCEYD